MKKMKSISILLCSVLLATSLAGCGSAAGQDENPAESAPSDRSVEAVPSDKPSDPVATPSSDEGEAVVITDIEAQALLSPQGNPDPNAVTVAQGANDFAFRLSSALVAEAGDGNFVCSPYSVWLPLAALVNATDEEHRDALVSAIGASGISASDINNAASRMLYDLTKQRSKEDALIYGEEYAQDPLKIANAIFVGNDVTLNTRFAQTFMDYYRGNAMTVDFRSPSAVEAVNQWASDHTEGLITDIIKEFDPLTVAAIANAIYFSDRWDWEFDPEKTEEDVFHSPNGDTQAQYMLRDGGIQSYYEDERVQALPLSFKGGDGLYIILPKDGDATGLLAEMTNDYFDQIRRNSVDMTGKLLLPRFTIESEVMELKDILTALGVPLFDEEEAPLTGGLLEEDYIDVWASSAVQKAMIEVDEKGTTAAAVTVISMVGNGMPMLPPETFEMICNKPFVFVLYGRTYDGWAQVLFTGVVNEP